MLGLILALALLVAASSCAANGQVRYAVPLRSRDAELCARLCSRHHQTESGAYARCLGTCPGAIETKQARCPAPSPRVACGVDERQGLDPALAAIIGSAVVTYLVTLLVLLQ